MSRKGKEAKGRRKESYWTVLIFTCIASLILRVPLIYMTGEKGVAFGSFAIELYVAAGCFFTYFRQQQLHLSGTVSDENSMETPPES